jgi:hypothetical protein
MAKLPKILTKIDTENDHNQLTPIFNEHKKKMIEFGNYKQTDKWESQQR